MSQEIEPNTTWFSDLIQPGAGNARIEEKAFAVASYGKQLGHLTDLLIEIAEHSKELSPDAVKTLDSLRSIRTSIESIKTAEYRDQVARLAVEVHAIRQRGGEPYAQLLECLQPVLTGKAER